VQSTTREGGGNPDGGDDSGGGGDGSQSQMAGASLVKPSMLPLVDSVSVRFKLFRFSPSRHRGHRDVLVSWSIEE
jgi:hypothetical protein